MREIKFRAWDKTYSLMNYKVQVGNTDYADQNYTCNSIWVDYGDNNSVGWINADEKCIELMQYTGLKDKNGKEIYEGDIIEFYFLGSDEKAEIVYNEDRAMFCLQYNKNKLNGWHLNPSKYNVLGNIYENPELLKN